MPYYLITEEKMQELLEAYKANGISNQEVSFGHFEQVTNEVLPPYTPDPDHNRGN